MTRDKEWHEMSASEKADKLKSDLHTFIDAYNNNVVRTNHELNNLKESLREISQKDKTLA